MQEMTSRSTQETPSASSSPSHPAPRPAKARTPHRRGRRKPRRDARWLADELSKGPSGLDRARVLLGAVDEVLRGVERLAWDVRGIATETRGVWNGVRGNAQGHRNGGAASTAAKYRRLASTGLMLGEVALGYRMHALRAAFTSREASAEALEALHSRSAERFYETSVAHGGAFLKLGQLLSARHDLLPDAWIEELSRLQDQVPALDLEAIRPILETELSAPLTGRFASFEPQAIAAASIGQVHRATTLDGRTVAVKIQRPNIAELLETDLALLDMFLLSMTSLLPPMDIETVRSEVTATLRTEVDYVRERETMATVAAFFAGHERIGVPAPVPELCTEHVLTAEFVQGRKITDVLDELARARDDGDADTGRRIDAILGATLEAYVRMILETGVFQADPHPGNLLVTAEDRLVVLDFGAACHMTDETRRRYGSLLRAFVFDDREALAAILQELGFRTASGAPDTLVAFAEALLHEMRDSMQKNGPVSWPSKEQLLDGAAELLRQAERDPVVAMPPEFVMIARVFGTLGGLFARYRPALDVGGILLPVFARVMSGN